MDDFFVGSTKGGEGSGGFRFREGWVDEVEGAQADPETAFAVHGMGDGLRFVEALEDEGAGGRVAEGMIDG